MTIQSRYLHCFSNSKLFKDSFWAIFGNGLGYGLLLLSGILIARFLGKDVYGEYGMVKTTMFYIAAFSTFGLGYTSTKFVAQAKAENEERMRGIMHGSLKITFCSSVCLAILLIGFAPLLAAFLEEPSLALPFRLLGGIIVFKAISTTQQGILAGLGRFKSLALNNVLAGLVMAMICVPLTYYFGLKGALSALALSQVTNVVVNAIVIYNINRSLPFSDGIIYVRSLLVFSFPVALQEFSYTLSNWGSSMLLVKYASLGEMGIFSATVQWNAIITFIPGLLSNVVLSHLSGSLNNGTVHNQTIYRMLLVNLCCTLLPFLLVFTFSEWISSFYGPSFKGMVVVLQVIVFATVFTCCSNVFQSEMIAQGRTWVLFSFRLIRDVLLLGGTYWVLVWNNGNKGAFYFSIVSVVSAALYFVMLISFYRFSLRKPTSNCKEHVC